ncbi:hypothetical protein PF005_g18035 [Phytophthora fragariae]|uniref:Uncharacterized protein n=1 Tax=Phytophthora fragariae TaxID=53985 RepID=A0A6A3SQX3_9STRA|nr:hypothetical protein PF006_g17694 [Phytophthora fragariae]KAE9193510.1 hypothetical protein PF005_g18035 [Phytophthora fragariae]
MRRSAWCLAIFSRGQPVIGIANSIAQPVAPGRIFSRASKSNTAVEESPWRGNPTMPGSDLMSRLSSTCTVSTLQDFVLAFRSNTVRQRFDGSMWTISSRRLMTAIWQTNLPCCESRTRTHWKRSCDLASDPSRGRTRQCMAPSNPVRSPLPLLVPEQCVQFRCTPTVANLRSSRTNLMVMDVFAVCTSPQLKTVKNCPIDACPAGSGAIPIWIATWDNTPSRPTWACPPRGAHTAGLVNTTIWDAGEG